MPRKKFLEHINRLRESQSAEARRAQEHEAKIKARDEKLKALGVDPDVFEKDPERAFEEAATRRYQKKLDEATMPESELQLRRAQEELEATKKKLAEAQEADRKRAEESEKQQRTERVKAKANDLAREITSALEEANLPRNGATVARMIELKRQARQDGLDVPMSEIAKRTNEAIRTDVSHVIGGCATGKEVATLIGEKATELLRQYLLEEQLPAQQAFNPKPKQPTDSSAPKPIRSKHPNGYVTINQVRAMRS